MSDVTSIRELLVAISRLPEGRRVVRDVWYESQKEHWLGWLLHYNSAGAYNRKTTSGRDARFVYNHVVCPGLLTYLAQAAGVSCPLVARAKRIEQNDKTMMAQAGEIRKLIPWATVHAALVKNGHF